LISNGFYAATKRKAQTNDSGYEPTLSAATRNLGERVEIKIRDNGTGIPDEVREKLFNPFSRRSLLARVLALASRLAMTSLASNMPDRLTSRRNPVNSPNFASFSRA
jgi:C4-dicarboxylate-specific signal transduction histidine kinase